MLKEAKGDNVSDIKKDIKYYANKLAELLAQSEEFAEYCVARDNLQKNKNYSYLLADFRQQQLQLHLATLSGEDTSEDAQNFDIIFQNLAKEPVISDFLRAETRFYTLLSQVQRILGKDLELWSEADFISEKSSQILN
ncbi:MAG: YlbF family regulator [Bacillota bacterium]|jgi:cell fate (sporulation/competence/biofilm development) regulator YlbF (YheA/YmcA/DUF963 family)